MATVSAELNYLSPDTESSLRSNGRLFMQRDDDGSDSGLQGVRFHREQVEIHDGRAAARPISLDEHGFELQDRPLADPSLDFHAMAPVVERYYAECADLVAASTGADAVFSFDHNVRSAAGKTAGERIAGGQEVQGPARVVHGDYTLTSAPQRLRDLAQAPKINDTYAPLLGGRASLLDPERVEAAIAGGRFAFVNVWRNIDEKPVQSDPLALCAAHSVHPEDLAVFEIRYADRVGENYWARPNVDHEWIGFPEIERHEALLIKQWDSVGPLARTEGARGDGAEPDSPCTFSFHTAYYDAATMDGKPPRRSIEVRCVALWT